MTTVVRAPEQTGPAPGKAVPGRWRRFALAAICLTATVLYAWRIGSEGWGNVYYSAAVKSMSSSLTNFVFGSFDPLGVVTVDKPPMAFWPMVLSATVFGYHGWSLLLPQVVEGVAAVFLLYATVRRWAGENTALLAALVLALTPVTVAINRDTNPDTLMVLLLVAAAYAFTRSVQRTTGLAGATRWLLLAAVLLGFGFVTKMLQAWIVVPAFGLAYLVGAAAPMRRRVLDLLGAGAVLLAGSMWWVALVGLWPGPKPYIGGSTDGTVLNLVIGYNGLGRIFGPAFGRQVVGGPAGGGGFGGGGPRGGGARGFPGFGGGTGSTRMFGEQIGGQISWLLPLALLVLIGVAVAGVRRMRARGSGEPVPGDSVPGDSVRRAGWFLWGGWLLLVGLVLSFAQGIFHGYYTTEMAPALAAVTAAGVAIMWRQYRRPGGYLWLALPAAVALTAGWAWVLVSRDTSWNGWLRYAVAAVAVLAVLLLVLVRFSTRGTGTGLARVAGVAGLVALLGAPGVWSAATAFAAQSGIGMLAQAGPPGAAFGHGGFAGRGGPARPGGPGGRGAFFAHGELPAQFQSVIRGDLTVQQREILDYARAGSGDARITLAVEGGAMAAEAYIVNSDVPVIGMGGFSGQDPVPTAATLAQWVQQGQLRFVLVGARGERGPARAGSGVAAAAGGAQAGRAQAGRAQAGRGGASGQRIQWVQQHCTVVDPAAYGGSAPQPDALPAGPFGGSQVLYDCQGR
ncbi:MAG: glycosyltransferase family 39 protein [Pseudonocardiaceae bacterium]